MKRCAQCMNLKFCTDILYLQYTSIGAIPVPVLDLDILWASEFVLWVWSQAGKFVLWHIPQCISDHNDGTYTVPLKNEPLWTNACTNCMGTVWEICLILSHFSLDRYCMPCPIHLVLCLSSRVPVNETKTGRKMVVPLSCEIFSMQTHTCMDAHWKFQSIGV